MPPLAQEGPTKPRNIRRTFQGVPLVIEYRKGDRKGDKNDPTAYGWYMDADYGYITETVSNECGEELDVYVGPDPTSTRVFLLPLMHPDDNESFMEYKVLLGFTNHKQAKNFGEGQYYDGMCGPIVEMTIDDLKDWRATQVTKAERENRADDERERAEEAARTTAENARTMQVYSPSGDVVTKAEPV